MGNVIWTPNTRDGADGTRVGDKNALDTRAHAFAEQVVVSDAVEAGTTTQYIIATAHAVRKGDMLRFLTGALTGVEVQALDIIDANTIKVETLSAAPAIADTFSVLRWRTPQVSSSGGLVTSAVASFLRDSVVTDVTEDTVTPANNRPLPVKLISATGDITITADNLDVQLTHAGASPDSVQIGDGTNTLPLYVEDVAAPGANVGISTLAVRNSAGAVLTNADGDWGNLTVDDTGRLRVDAAIIEAATAADGSAGLPAVSKVVAGYDGANIRTVHTDAAGDVQVDLASSIPAGTNNIGDVDVLSLPGGLTGYAEDAAHGSGDIGVMALAVRNDAGATLAGTDGDYAPISVDASGNVRIAGTVSTSEQAVAADGAAGLPAVSKVVAGYDGANVRTMHTDAAGDVQVDLASSIPAGTNNIGDVDVLTEPATAADGAAALPAVSKVVAGWDGANVRTVHTDAAGDVQVDLASALPAGTNNIGDVDVLTLPGSLRGYTEDTAHVTGDFGLMPLAVRRDADTSLVDTDGDYAPLQVNSTGSLKVAVIGNVSTSSGGKSVVTTVRNDYTSTSVTTGAWVQLVASLGATVTELEIFDSSGETLELGTGAAAAETRLILVFPGGNGRVPVSIASGTRLSIRAVSATASVGELDLNIYGV